LIFAIWVLTNVVGVFSLMPSFTPNQPSVDERKSMTLDMRKTSRGDINMRNN